MPRQSRRARTQAGARKRSDAIAPRHPHLRTSPLLLEPEEETPDTVERELAATDEPLVPIRQERRFTAMQPTQSGDNPFRRPSAAAEARRTASEAIESRVAMTDYGYVIGELKRIFITAGVVVLLLAVVAIVNNR